MNRIIRGIVCTGAATLLSVTGLGTTPALAAGGNGGIGVYQVGLSFNDNGPASGGSGGGFWGWWDVDSPTNDPNSGYGGDGQAEGCGHGGGFNGAGHSVFDIRDWHIAFDPDMGVPTFWASWTETDSFRGQSQTFDVTDQSTGIPAFTVHRKILQAFGIPTPPGSAANVQVSWKPAR